MSANRARFSQQADISAGRGTDDTTMYRDTGTKSSRFCTGIVYASSRYF